VTSKWRTEWSSLKEGQKLLPGPLSLNEARSNYQDNTRTLSTVGRQLAFAGIALIWLFKVTVGGNPTIAEDLRVPALLLVGALAADLLQYISSASSWGLFELRMERKFQRERLDEHTGRFGAPNSINWPGNTFLVIKIVALVIAYVWLFIALYHQMF
jgi:hypothetical protein